MLNEASGSQRQFDHYEFKAYLVFIVSSRTTSVTQWDLISVVTTTGNKQTITNKKMPPSDWLIVIFVGQFLD